MSVIGVGGWLGLDCCFGDNTSKYTAQVLTLKAAVYSCPIRTFVNLLTDHKKLFNTVNKIRNAMNNSRQIRMETSEKIKMQEERYIYRIKSGIDASFAEENSAPFLETSKLSIEPSFFASRFTPDIKGQTCQSLSRATYSFPNLSGVKLPSNTEDSMSMISPTKMTSPKY